MSTRKGDMPRPVAAPIARRLLAFALLGGLFALYVALRPLALHVSDSYAWVNTVDTSAFAYFYHPHHLLYIPLAWRWNELVHFVAPPVSAWTAMCALSALFGCAGVAALYLTLRRLGARASAALAGAALPAFAFGYWFFASNPEVYTISAACALWCFYFLACLATGGGPRMALWAGAAAAFAALFHQTGVFLFAPAAVVAISRGRAGVRVFALFTAAFGAIVAPAYILAAWASIGSLAPAAFARWLFLFAGEGYGGISLAAALKAPIGAARGIVGGQEALDVLRGAHEADWVFAAGLMAAAVACIAASALVVKSIRRVRFISAEGRTIAIAAAVAFAVYAAFSVYFDSSNFEWWTIPPAILAIAVAVPALCTPRPAVVAAGVATAAVCLANLCLDFSYRRDPGNDFLLNAARVVSSVSSPADVIVAPSYLGSLIWYESRDRRVFCPDKVRRMIGDAGLSDALLAEARAAEPRGGRIIIAGADREGETSGFVKSLESGTSPSDWRVIASMRFLDGGRCLVKTVGPVPLTAIDASAAVDALSRSHVACAGGAVGE